MTKKPHHFIYQNKNWLRKIIPITAQKTKFSIKDFFIRYDQIYRFLRILSHLLKKALMKNFIFCAMCHIIMTNKITPFMI